MTDEERGRWAKQLLDNPLFAEVSAQLGDSAKSAVLNVDVGDVPRVQAAVLKMQAAHAFSLKFQQLASMSEREAKKEIERANKKPFMSRFKP